MSHPAVSVCLITYKQEEYVRQAIESILMQQVNFSWELIIADDNSPDDTRKIISEYKTKHPELIKLLFQEKNVGGGKNFVDLISAAKGKYIAYLEGDDYWTDPLKLQQQFDLMEANPGLSLCYHKVKWTHTYATDHDTSLESNVNDPAISNIDDVINKGWFIRSCTMFFKNIELPEGFEKLYIGDYPLHVLLAGMGNIGFLNKSMAVYRINDKGLSETQLVTEDITKRKMNMRSEIDLIKYMDQHTSFKYHHAFLRKLFETSYSHLTFLRKTDKKRFMPEFFYLVMRIGPFDLVKGMVNKMRHKKRSRKKGDNI